MNRRQCPIQGCETLIPRHLLMCPAHWRKVARPLQAEVYRSYRAKVSAATEQPDVFQRALQTYLAAAAQAIEEATQ